MVQFVIDNRHDSDSVKIEVNGLHRGRIDSYRWKDGRKHLITILDGKLQTHGLNERVESGIMIDGKAYGICADHIGLNIGPMI